jgi:hypothetical protein
MSDHNPNPRHRVKDKIKEKLPVKKFKWTFDDIVYSQRLFFVLIALLIGTLIFNPWVLYQAEKADEDRDARQTQNLLKNSDRNFMKLEDVLETLQKDQENANIRGNLTLVGFNTTLERIDQSVIAINRSQAEQSAQEANLTRAETDELVKAIRDSANVIPVVNQSLIRLNETLVEQLIPVVATLELQQKAEIDHHNQTKQILDSIGLSGNLTREQAELINRTEQVLGQDSPR